MKLKLTLAQKAMVFLAIPIILQLWFFVTYRTMLDRAEQLGEQEYHSKAVTGRLNWEAMLISVEALCFLSYELSHDKQYIDAFASCKKELKPTMDGIDELVADDKTQSEQLKVVRACVDKLDQFMDHKLNDPPMDLSSKEFKDLTGADMKQRWSIMCEARKAIVKVEKHRYRVNASDLPNARKSLKNVLNIGLGMDIGVVFLLLFLYGTSIAKRLNILTDNSYRLVRGEALNPPIGGSDEIGTLDGSFHFMADALTQAHEKEKAVIDNMLVGLITLTPDGRIESLNPRIETIFGVTRDELLKKDIMSLFVSPSDSKETFDFSNYLLSQSLNRIAEIDARRTNGEIFPIELSISQFDSKEGKKYLANILDVSERREVEKLKRAFVATVTHELRTPLTSIRGSLTILQSGAMGPMTEAMKNTVAIAERNSIRLITLINDILDIEKLQTGTVQMNKVNIRLAKIIERSLESVKMFAEQYDVRVEAAPTDFIVYADPDKLVQVVVNLVSNAVKFSKPNSAVSISVKEIDDFIEVSVTDTGIGIPSQYLGTLFQRFQQVQSVDPRHKGGTGLGLAICKQIVEQNGGSIGVKSKEGWGSTFWFTVHKAASETNETVPEESVADSRTG